MQKTLKTESKQIDIDIYSLFNGLEPFINSCFMYMPQRIPYNFEPKKKIKYTNISIIITAHF